jgi:hypothetical protein
VLVAHRLAELETRAITMLTGVIPGAAKLPLTQFIGRQALFRDHDVLDAATDAALRERIVTKLDLNEARDVE